MIRLLLLHFEISQSQPPCSCIQCQIKHPRPLIAGSGCYNANVQIVACQLHTRLVAASRNATSTTRCPSLQVQAVTVTCYTCQTQSHLVAASKTPRQTPQPLIAGCGCPTQLVTRNCIHLVAASQNTITHNLCPPRQDLVLLLRCTTCRMHPPCSCVQERHAHHALPFAAAQPHRSQQRRLGCCCSCSRQTSVARAASSRATKECVLKC
jgi:hypothetical protein